MFFLKPYFKLDFMMKSANSLVAEKSCLLGLSPGAKTSKKYETTFQEEYKSPEGNNVDVVLC